MPKYYRLDAETIDRLRMLAWLLENEAKHIQKCAPDLQCSDIAKSSLDGAVAQPIMSGDYLEGLAAWIFQYCTAVASK